MITVRYNPAQETDPTRLEFWRQWRVRAERATKHAIKAFEIWVAGNRTRPWQYDWNNEVWTDLKVWLKENLFHHKCAYCERRMDGYYGDAEHYRPKGAVLNYDRDGKEQPIFCKVPDPAGQGELDIAHPGYFWLAYDWRNLVPACPSCNSGTGKNERFDTKSGNILVVKIAAGICEQLPSELRPLQSNIWEGHYYHPPEVLNELEKPLFLFPLNPSPDMIPREHLQFGNLGTVVPRNQSEIGKRTIEIFKLAEEEGDNICRSRQKRQEEFRRALKEMQTALKDKQTKLQEIEALLDELEQGREPFSAACLDYYSLYYDALPKPR